MLITAGKQNNCLNTEGMTFKGKLGQTYVKPALPSCYAKLCTGDRKKRGPETCFTLCHVQLIENNSSDEVTSLQVSNTTGKE